MSLKRHPNIPNFDAVMPLPPSKITTGGTDGGNGYTIFPGGSVTTTNANPQKPIPKPKRQEFQEQPTCPKCNNGGPFATHKFTYVSHTDYGRDPDEHIVVACGKCAYIFEMDCYDKVSTDIIKAMNPEEPSPLDKASEAIRGVSLADKIKTWSHSK